MSDFWDSCSYNETCGKVGKNATARGVFSRSGFYVVFQSHGLLLMSVSGLVSIGIVFVLRLALIDRPEYLSPST